ncbi:vegetative cell wall protein gp1-like [Oryza sativa Japonica Group]|uniref:vegetative cell wall protein gp1-like n=1 Tax=Oryza sativa subsp. japonica TaxID=39947 RepID=UPI00339CAB00
MVPPPRRRPLSPVPPAIFSRPCRRVSTSAGRAVASSSIAAASSSPACPPFPAETPGATFPPSPFSFLRAGRLQPPLPPRPSAARPRRLLPRPRSRLLSLGQPSVSRGNHRRRALAGKTVALPPLYRLQSPRSPRQSVGRCRRLLPRRRHIALHPGLPSVSPERRREPLRPPHRSCSAARPSSPVHRSAAPPPPSASQPRRRPRHRFPFGRTPPVSVVVFTVHPRRLVVSRRRLRRRHRSGVFLAILASVQPLPAALVVSSPAPVVVVVILPSFPVVVAFVPPSSRSRPSSAFVQCAAAAPVVVFVLGSVSSSLVPAASRLRPRIAAEVVPSLSVSAAPVRRCRSLASSRGGL